MGFLDALGSIAVAGMDAAMKNDNFVAGVALSRNGDRKLENFASARNRIANATERSRISNSRNVEPLTNKQAMIGIGVLAAVGIAAAILNNSSKNDNNSTSKKTNNNTQPT